MRNTLQYPISYEEANELLKKLEQEFKDEQLIGDMRPLLIKWIMDRLLELRKLEDQFDKLKRERLPNKGY
jgi:hypothetical protein